MWYDVLVSRVDVSSFCGFLIPGTTGILAFQHSSIFSIVNYSVILMLYFHIFINFILSTHRYKILNSLVSTTGEIRETVKSGDLKVNLRPGLRSCSIWKWNKKIMSKLASWRCMCRLGRCGNREKFWCVCV